MRTDADRARDMLEAVSRIEARTSGGKAAFTSDEMLQVWVFHHLEILGEAAKGLSEGFRESRPGPPWRAVARMRDRLAHGYWDVDLDAVWQVVKRDPPGLEVALAPD
ncbi:MAG: HepT-like ribonuclease domain-containing protein [Candidatus Dormibacteraceae bacterium]